AAGIEIVLVGDSLGMVVQGRASTLGVSVDHMVYHCAAVARGAERALLIGDMPFASYPSPPRAFANAARLLAEGGMSMVKLEGAGPVLASIEYLSARDIPVCAHLGLTPQSVHRMGGFRVQGRSVDSADRLKADALAAAAAGAALLVLEGVPAGLAREITAASPIPTIGIGAGVDCDGQILVCYDILGMTRGHRPRFVADFMQGTHSIHGAFVAFATAVRERRFPDASQSY
ncbi:MAG: 3-methyl-2-oxobutanoate hydroxymethyltransferase, partial [Lysobacterales bacterium]